MERSGSGIGKLIRRLVRRPAALTTVSVEPDELLTFNFFQFKSSTAAFFFERLGRTKVTNLDTPHYAFARALAEGQPDAVAQGETYYRAYLHASWGERPAHAFDERVREFRETFAHYKANGISKEPVLTNLPTSSAPYIVDGNHRCAMAAALRLPLSAVVLDPNETFRKYSKVPGFYGTDNKDMPYQSITLSGQDVVEGRRCDLAERLSMVPKDCLVDQRVLDIACNVGMSSLLAYSMGAQSTLGLEVSEKMVDLANRFSMFDGAYPSVRFRPFNIDQEDFGDEKFDTAFIFSIYKHLEKPEKLAEIVERNVTGCVIFETHPRGQLTDYPRFFDAGLFSSVTEIGRLHTSRFKQDRSRTVFLCRR